MTPTPTTIPLRSPAETPPSDTLMALLGDDLRFSPSIGGVFSDHLAMMLVALDQFGAPTGRLRQVFDRHASGEAELRDDHDDLAAMLALVERDGIAATVQAVVPELTEGPGTALFHPLIRLPYALDIGHPGQVAAALLDWRRRHDVLPLPPASAGGRHRLADVAAQLAAQPPGTWSATYDLHGIARRTEMSAAIDGLATDERTLDDVVRFAIAAHATADAFVTLHLVTGARAVHAVAAWVDDHTARRLAAGTARTMAVAYAAVGAPPLLDAGQLDAMRGSELPGPRDIVALAVGDSDPHVVKLTNVCLIEEARTGDPLYRYVAARTVGLVPSGG